MLLWTVYLMPLAFYLVNLGQQYQLGRPKLSSGHTDLARLFSALSGIVLVGGPRLLALLHHKWILLELSAGPTHSWYLARPFWMFLFFLYAFTVSFVCIWLWRKRSGISVVFPATKDLVRQATESAGFCDPVILTEDTKAGCVEILWSQNGTINQPNGEKKLAPILEEMRVDPGWFWMMPVGLGLGLLMFLATLNLGSAFWVFRS